MFYLVLLTIFIFFIVNGQLFLKRYDLNFEKILEINSNLMDSALFYFMHFLVMIKNYYNLKLGQRVLNIK